MPSAATDGDGIVCRHDDRMAALLLGADGGEHGLNDEYELSGLVPYARNGRRCRSGAGDQTLQGTDATAEVWAWIRRETGGAATLDDLEKAIVACHSDVAWAALRAGYEVADVLPHTLDAFLDDAASVTLVHSWSRRASATHDRRVRDDARRLVHLRALALFRLAPCDGSTTDRLDCLDCLDCIDCLETAAVRAAMASSTPTSAPRHHDLAADVLEIAASRVLRDGCSRARQMLDKAVSSFAKRDGVSTATRERLSRRYVALVDEHVTPDVLARLEVGTLVDTFSVAVHCGMQAVAGDRTGFGNMYARLLFLYSRLTGRFVDEVAERLRAVRARLAGAAATDDDEGCPDPDGGPSHRPGGRRCRCCRCSGGCGPGAWARAPPSAASARVRSRADEVDDHDVLTTMLVVVMRVCVELLRRLPWTFGVHMLAQPALDLLVDLPPYAHAKTAADVAEVLATLHVAVETGRRGPSAGGGARGALARSLAEARVLAGATADPRMETLFSQRSVWSAPWAVVVASVGAVGELDGPPFLSDARRREAAHAQRAMVDARLAATKRVLETMGKVATVGAFICRS